VLLDVPGMLKEREGMCVDIVHACCKCCAEVCAACCRAPCAREVLRYAVLCCAPVQQTLQLLLLRL
jgi:hypothetical protein